MSNPEVAVIGAGYAGLAAALSLGDAGVEVVVLEARDRVGGRVWSVPLRGGEVAELGGEWIFEGYEVLEELARRFALELLPTGVDYALRDAPGVASVADQVAFLEAATHAADAVPSSELEGATLGPFLEGVPGDEPARAAVRARLQGTCAVDLGRVSLGVAWREGLLDPRGAGPTWRLARGNGSLADTAAAALPEVRLGTTAERVVADGLGVRVSVRSGGATAEVRAGAVVVTVPAPVLRSLGFEPELPADVRAALDALPFGVASKLVVATQDEPSPRSRQSVDGPFWWWAALGEGGRPRRCVTAFAGSPTAQEGLGVGSGDPAVWVARLRSLDPEVGTGDARLVSWGEDPFARGAYSAMSNEVVPLLPALERPAGRVVLAGEHTAGPRWHGTMEGALRSGRRAAGQVLELLDRD